jgi:hypothetical protein
VIRSCGLCSSEWINDVLKGMGWLSRERVAIPPCYVVRCSSPDVLILDYPASMTNRLLLFIAFQPLVFVIAAENRLRPYPSALSHPSSSGIVTLNPPPPCPRSSSQSQVSSSQPSLTKAKEA